MASPTTVPRAAMSSGLGEATLGNTTLSADTMIGYCGCIKEGLFSLHSVRIKALCRRVVDGRQLAASHSRDSTWEEGELQLASVVFAIGGSLTHNPPWLHL